MSKRACVVDDGDNGCVGASTESSVLVQFAACRHHSTTERPRETERERERERPSMLLDSRRETLWYPRRGVEWDVLVGSYTNSQKRGRRMYFSNCIQ